MLTLIFFLSTCWLLYLKMQPAEAPVPTEMTVTLTPPAVEKPETASPQAPATPVTLPVPAIPRIPDEEIQRLRDHENENKELKLLLERVSAELKVAAGAKETLERMIAGRQMLRDFERRFLTSSYFREHGGFLSFLRKKTEAYLSRGEMKVSSSSMKNAEFNAFHKELVGWILQKSEEEIEGSAQFMAFFFAETLYEIPLTLLASRLTPELEAIDFDTPVLIGNILTTAKRDGNGEMAEEKPAHLDQYSMSQQFFFRRGPKITERSIIFLKAYLSHTEI